MGGTIVQAIINGILIGGFYSLMGMGLNVIFGVMKIINFCQGELLMLGMYISLVLHTVFGMDPYLSILFVAPIMAVLGMIIQHTLITPALRIENSSNLLFMTIGLGILLQNGALLVFKSDYRSIKVSYSSQILNIAGQTISLPKLVSFAVLLVVTIALFVFFKKTTIGKKIRATSQNPIGAKIVGIRTNWIYMITYGLGSALAGAAGCLLLPFYFVYPMVGETYGLRAFVVVVMGGLGNISGAFIAGIILGLLETLGSLLIGPSLKDSVVFLTFIIILIVKQKLKLQQKGG